MVTTQLTWVLSDFSLVATTLDTNNAYKFMSGIEGMDRFGTGPVRSAISCYPQQNFKPISMLNRLRILEPMELSY